MVRTKARRTEGRKEGEGMNASRKKEKEGEKGDIRVGETRGKKRYRERVKNEGY